MTDTGQIGLYIRSRIPGPISDVGLVGTKMFDLEKCCDLGV